MRCLASILGFLGVCRVSGYKLLGGIVFYNISVLTSFMSPLLSEMMDLCIGLSICKMIWEAGPQTTPHCPCVHTYSCQSYIVMPSLVHTSHPTLYSTILKYGLFTPLILSLLWMELTTYLFIMTLFCQ